MQFYRRLQLPSNPVRLEKIEELIQSKKTHVHAINYQTNHYNPKDFLTSELIEIFQQLGVEPENLAHFGSPKNSTGGSRLHIDLVNKNYTWVTVPFAINWDLTPGTLDLSWYDTTGLTVFPPTDEHLRTCDTGGIRFGYTSWDDKHDLVPIETLSFERNTPYLVRTDVPHQTRYMSLDPVRVSVSLRFPPHIISSWQQALEIFKPIIV